MTKFYTVFTVLILLMVSCNSEKKSSNATYFGGEIINPKDNYVILLKGDQVIDSISLNDKNKFITKIEDFEPGLYHFYHKPEYQYIYLEKGDSLLLRLNTIEFDESLVFSGTGAKKNNFLINTFLDHENDHKNFFNVYKPDNFYKLNPEDFKSKIDSLRAIKHQLLLHKGKKAPFSKEYLRIAEASIDLDINSIMEKYIIHNANKELPKNFYDYRKDFKLDDNALFTYHPYHNYLYDFANNVAFSRYSEKSNALRETMKTPTYNHHKLKILDSIIKNQTLKNQLTKRAALEFLSKTTCKDKAKDYFNAFAKINTDEAFVAEVKELTKSITNLEAGNPIPNITVSSQDKVMPLSELIEKPTVFFFWTSDYKRHLKVVHEKVKYLKLNHEDIAFIGLNLDKNNKVWQEIVDSYKFDKQHEFQLSNVNKAKQELMLNSYHKIIIVDENGKILSTNSNIFDVKFEDHLASLFQ